MNKTPISILQELMVQRKESLPDYYIESCTGSPGVSFMCTVKIGKLKAVGFASTKKDAKQNSAKNALELLGLKNAVEQQISSGFITGSTTTFQKNYQCINYVGQLNEYASAHDIPYPNYYDEVVALNGRFVTRCCFVQWTTEGYGLRKKDSKQDAARKMLEKLTKENISLVITKTEALELNRIEKISKLNQEILRNYEILSSPSSNAVSNFTKFPAIPNLNKKVTSLEELKVEMKKFGYDCKFEVFQRNQPYIMMMKIKDTHAVLMGMGDTKEEAICDLFESATYMFTNGFTLKTEL